MSRRERAGATNCRCKRIWAARKRVGQRKARLWGTRFGLVQLTIVVQPETARRLPEVLALRLCAPPEVIRQLGQPLVQHPVQLSNRRHQSRYALGAHVVLVGPIQSPENQALDPFEFDERLEALERGRMARRRWRREPASSQVPIVEVGIRDVYREEEADVVVVNDYRPVERGRD